jgi:hypothetical protein
MIRMRTSVVVKNEFVENLSGTAIINLATLKYLAKCACNDPHERIEVLLIIITVHRHCRDEGDYEEGQVRSYEDDISRLNTHLQDLLRHRSRY